MPGSISLLLSRTDPTAQGSVAYVNDTTGALLRETGWTTRPFRPPVPAHTEEATLPLGLASLHALELTQGSTDFALYDDAGATIRTPSRSWAKRNVVLYHGLAYGAGAWMANPAIDLHCANSPYLARVLRALFAFPDWHGRRCLDARAFATVTDIALPLPCVASPEGHRAFMEGAEFPASVARLLQGPTILGHALQGRKHDVMAMLSILLWLNELARRDGTPPVKLLLSASALPPERRHSIDAMLAPSGRRCDDFFVLLPHLKQRALFEVMRACRFGLAYNRFPEPFGFYVLESVYHGCPIYTNGTGNNRHLLPEGHGIHVHETLDMASDVVEASAYRGVAERIHEDLSQPDAVRAACERGGAVARSRWSREAFAISLEAALARVDGVPPHEPVFDSLVVGLSPMVRQLDRATGRCLNDYANTILGAEEIAVVDALLGHFCEELDGARMQALEERHGLFRRGILTLVPPGEACRPSRNPADGSGDTVPWPLLQAGAGGSSASRYS